MARELAASLLLLPVAGCSLVLDFSDRAIPIDAAVDGPAPPVGCDYKEPNETVATAAVIAPGDTGPAALCSATDHDFYKITVPAMTSQVAIRIAFSQRSGDLDLRLTDKTGQTMLAASLGFGDEEAIVCPSSACAALAADDYVFEVFPVGAAASNPYTLALVLTPATAR